MRWAIVNPSSMNVDNVVIWGGDGNLFDGMLTIQLDPDERCAPGWTYDSAATPRFLEPTPPSE